MGRLHIEEFNRDVKKAPALLEFVVGNNRTTIKSAVCFGNFADFAFCQRYKLKCAQPVRFVCSSLVAVTA